MLTYKLYASLRTDKKRTDGSCPIHFFLRVGGAMSKIPTGKSCNENEWNKKTNTAKSNSAKGIALASFLNKKIAEFNTFMLSEEAMGRPITLTLAKSFFENTNKADFYQFWDEQIELWKHEKKYNTLKGYVTTYRMLKEVAPKLSFGDLTLSFIQKFDAYLANVKKNCANSRFSKHKALRCMVRQAIIKKHMKKNPYEDFKLKPAIGQRVFLTVGEVNMIAQYEIASEGKNLQIAKDLFLFSVYTGLRFSDIVGLKYGNIKGDHLELVMEKTSKPLIMPLMPEAGKLIEKYKKNNIVFDDKTVFPNVANSTINKNLKELMKLVGIKKSVSMHIGRHTYASVHLHAGTSLAHLQRLLGHNNIQDTMIYAKTMTEDLYSSMENFTSIFRHAEAI